MVFAAIEARLGCSLSPTTIVQAPTVARLAEFIQSNESTLGSQSCVPLRTAGADLPLFLVHNLYCYPLYYRHLLNDLKSDRPVFGLQPPPVDGKHRVPRTVETIAAEYVTEIRLVQPHGPYFIAGHSFGGLVSFEIAQQLVREGERVSFLGLIDTGLRDLPAEPRSRSSMVMRIGHRIFGFFGKLKWIRQAILKRWYYSKLNFGRPIPYKHRPDLYDWLCRRANRQYMPKPYTGHITIFSSAGNYERQRVNWGPLAGAGMTILEVPASHNDMVLPPHCKFLAKHFDASLNAVVLGE
jgi:thioesterase domain-containing protein